MNIIKKMLIVFFLLTLSTVYAFGEDTSTKGKQRRHHGPPPEAFTACEGKSAGDTAEFVSPRGDTVTGTCEEADSRLVLRPDNPPGRGAPRGDKNADDSGRETPMGGEKTGY